MSDEKRTIQVEMPLELLTRVHAEAGRRVVGRKLLIVAALNIGLAQLEASNPVAP